MSEAERAEELEMDADAEQARSAGPDARRVHGSVAHRVPFVFMFQTFSSLLFFFWRCGGMMLLGHGPVQVGLPRRAPFRPDAVQPRRRASRWALLAW